MSKQEFLQHLRDALTGEVSGNVVEENIQFYNEYISTEGKRGLTEEEVIESIGDPRLIARTIIDASESLSFSGKTHYESNSESSSKVYDEKESARHRMSYIDFSKWYWKLLAAGAFILVFFLVITIVTGIIGFLLPVLGPLFFALLILWFIRGFKR